MEDQKLNITIPSGATDVNFRTGTAKKELPELEPVKTNISGTIGTVQEYLSKRINAKQFEQKDCHIIVNREMISISLVINESDPYHKGDISGTLDFHPAFKKFGINSNKAWTPTELGMFFKMNRAFFPDLTANMKLVTDLMNFTGTVNNKIERSAKENGDRTDNFSQVVNSNLPPSFKLTIPIFKGMSAENLEVETFAQIDGREVKFALISPGAQQALEEIRDNVIDGELTNIVELAPDIAIIEV